MGAGRCRHTRYSQAQLRTKVGEMFIREIITVYPEEYTDVSIQSGNFCNYTYPHVLVVFALSERALEGHWCSGVGIVEHCVEC